MVNEQYILDFKAAVKGLLKAERLNGRGLCSALGDATCYRSYGIMRAVLTADEYYGGLGESGTFTEERRQFLVWLDCLSVEDLLDFVENAHAN